jgi:hypothetical protein
LAKKKIPSIVKEVQQYTLPDVYHPFKKMISFSQFSMFESCPHKWSLQYRDGHYTSEVSIHMTFGTAIHEVMQDYLTAFYNVSITAADRINLEEQFEEKLREGYRVDYKRNKKEHFSSPEQLREFYEDGLGILSWFKKNKGKYFSKKGWWLVGIEVPITFQPNLIYQNLYYKGFLDVVLYNEKLNKIKIIDIKTSTRGWGDKEKNDEVKMMQLVLYKKFFSEQYGFPIDNINIEYFIVKRKLHGNPEYPAHRVQTHIPASGTIKLNKTTKRFQEFIEMAFNKDGSHNMGPQLKNPSKYNCTYCPFKDNATLCDRGLS